MEFGRGFWDAEIESIRAPDGSRSLLDWAIEHEDWELAALCLLVGVMRALEKVPPESVEAMLDELAGPLDDGHAVRRRRKERGRRGRHR